MSRRRPCHSACPAPTLPCVGAHSLVQQPSRLRQIRRSAPRTRGSAHCRDQPPGIAGLDRSRAILMQTRPKAVSDHQTRQQSP